MLSNLFFYFKLTWFCLKLVFDLVSFLFIFLLKKAKQKRVAEISLIILIILVWSINFYILRQKNITLINLEKIEIINNSDREFNEKQIVLTEDDLKTSLEAYREIENMKINSLGLYVNLATLNFALKNIDLSKEYFNKAQNIEPKIKIVEN